LFYFDFDLLAITCVFRFLDDKINPLPGFVNRK